LDYLISGIPHYGNIYVFVHGNSLHIYYGIIASWNIYLSVKSLRKPVDYQRNIIYFVFILERLPGYIDNWKELGHGLGYGPNSDLYD
jgi:hypothetical protein